MAELEAQYPEFRDRSVVVTGGGSGIGAAIVEGFARQGAKVSFIDIAEEESHALVDRLSRDSLHPVRFHHADLRDVAAIRATIEAIVAHSGPIGVLVNNAARDDRHDFDEVTPEYWDNNQATNLRHVFFAAQAVAPSMREAGGGAIINMSSIAFMLNMPDFPAYTTAKAAIIGLTKSLAGKLGPDNIRVNCILPGMIVTERQMKLWLTEEGIAGMIERQCIKRVLQADAIVGPCLFLASDGASAVTAQSLIVDGGIF
ncbi:MULTISPECIES: SDR family NAD(P)-dependent oxidoreductase [unclassified Rhizobium]|uniref:SDR family NAD(P)-dependent oxidoreductase n=1 Tax=unclassified Rhizobium TaxID=2613769 RepID=UPI001ADAA547|nr:MULTISPECIES: SDR family oxidoreductase [unclassified Rhizobium]MBO9122894.1 SDR family oxidoreductase [Rhizobium sp. 16-488-2b]MBO9173426.1 SDR family oxidoreductase [Rhizobium sp. 16-488-2a]